MSTGMFGANYPKLNPIFVNELEKLFLEVKTLEFAVSPVVKSYQCFKHFKERLPDGMPRSGGNFWVTLPGTPSPTPGKVWDDSVEYSYRKIPFSINVSRDTTQILKKVTNPQLDWSVIDGRSKNTSPQSMRGIIDAMGGEIRGMWHSIQNRNIKLMTRQLKEGSPMFVDFSAGYGSSAHANYPTLPTTLSNEMMNSFTGIVNKLGILGSGYRAVCHPAQFAKMMMTPLDKNMYFTNSDRLEKTYNHFGWDGNLAKQMVPNEVNFAGVKFRQYYEIETFGSAVSRGKPQDIKFAFKTKPHAVEGKQGLYYRATITNKGGGAVSLYPGDVLTYVGNNALCHVGKFTKEPIYPLRYSFAVTAMQWMEENGGYPGSYSVDPDTGQTVDLRNKTYETDCKYTLAAGASVDISFKNTLEFSTGNSKANTANRDIVENTDLFYLLGDSAQVTDGSYDPNYFFPDDAFYYFTDDMTNLSIEKYLRNIDENRSSYESTIRSLREKGQVYYGNSMKPVIEFHQIGPETGKVSGAEVGISCFYHVDTFGDQFNFIIPTKRTGSLINSLGETKTISQAGFDPKMFMSTMAQMMATSATQAGDAKKMEKK